MKLQNIIATIFNSFLCVHIADILNDIHFTKRHYIAYIFFLKVLRLPGFPCAFSPC
jgi:hypothetical protein